MTWYWVFKQRLINYLSEKYRIASHMKSATGADSCISVAVPGDSTCSFSVYNLSQNKRQHIIYRVAFTAT
jgi:hypothetical protein